MHQFTFEFEKQTDLPNPDKTSVLEGSGGKIAELVGGDGKINIGFEFLKTTRTAMRFIATERSIQSHGNPANPVALKIGDEAFGLNQTRTVQLEPVGPIYCRVGTCVVVLSSNSLNFDDLLAFATHIASRVDHLSPAAATVSVNEKRVIEFLDSPPIRDERGYEARVRTRDFTTAEEYSGQALKEHASTPEDLDENGLTKGGRFGFHMPGGILGDLENKNQVTEISLTRGGCYGWCPQYSVRLTSDGKVKYFGGRYVKKLGTFNGAIPTPEFQYLADFVQKADVMAMKDEYENLGISDLETVYTSFVVNGVRKSISNYANSGPLDVWAIEQLIDKLVSETEWESKKLGAKR